MSITSKEIAKLCGVSRGTVDRVLNNRTGVRAATRDKVLKVANELGYRPNYIGRSLVKGKSMSIGVIVFDIDNRIFAQIINGIETRARELGYFVNISFTFRDAELEAESLRQHIARNVDGVILSSVNQEPSYLQFVHELKIPVVTFGNRLSTETPYIWIDDRQAVKDAVKLIAAKGYEHIVYVSPPLERLGRENLYVPEQRYNGFRQAVESGKSLTFDVIAHHDYIGELLRSDFRSRRTAVLCSSDIYAIDIMNICKDQGIRIPEDLGVVGFDNIDILKYITPRLTTVGFYSENIGKEAVDCLMKLIEGREVPTIQLLKHAIIEGESL